MEAIKSYVNEQKAKMFYESFDTSSKELKSILSDGKDIEELETLDGLISELEDN